MPKLTIVVPVYNGEKCIVTMLETLADQDFADYEVLIIDDGSKDDTGKICREFVAKHDKFRYFVQPYNKGVSAARNRGIELAQSKYCSFVDADDWVEKDIFTTMLKLMEEQNADIGFSGAIRNEILHRLGKQAVSKLVTATGAELFAYNFGAIRSRSNPVFKLELIKNLQYDEKVKASEDLLFDIQALSHAQKAIFDPTPRYHYLVNLESTMHRQQDKAYFSSDLEAHKKIYSIVKDAKIADEDLKNYYYDICRTAFAMLRYGAKANDEKTFNKIRILYEKELQDYLKSGMISPGQRLKLRSYLLPFWMVKILHGQNKQNVKA